MSWKEAESILQDHLVRIREGALELRPNEVLIVGQHILPKSFISPEGLQELQHFLGRGFVVSFDTSSMEFRIRRSRR